MNDEGAFISLKQVEQLLSEQEFIWFLETLLLNATTESAQLQSCLERAEWQQAKDLAHQLRGVSYLARNESLSEYLGEIELQRTQLISTQAFQYELQQLLDDFQRYITQFIDAATS